MPFRKLLAAGLFTLISSTAAQATGSCSFFGPGSGHTGPQFLSPTGGGTGFTSVVGEKTTVTARAGTSGQFVVRLFSEVVTGAVVASTSIGSCTTPDGGACTVTGITPADGLIRVDITPLVLTKDSGSFEVLCEEGVASTGEIELAKQAGLAAALGKIQWMSSNIGSRGGNRGATFSTSGFRLSTQGMEGDGRRVTAWFAVEGAIFDGSSDGSNVIAGGGVEYDFGSTIAGIALSYDKMRLSTGAVEVEAEGASVAPYFIAQLGTDFELSGFLSYGRPDVDYGGGAVAASDRWVAHIRLTGDTMYRGMRVRPYADLSGYDQNIDAAGAFAQREVSRVALGLGSRIDLNPVSGFLPWVDLAVDAYKLNDTVGPDDSGFAPRIGVGATRNVGNGILSFGFNASSITSGLRSYSVKIGYDANF